VPSGLKVFRNFVGTNAVGDAAIANSTGGLTLSAPGAQIIGNLIAGNNGSGLILGAHFLVATTAPGQQFASADGAMVEGNRIGLNLAGTAALANTGTGVAISAPNVRVGGPTAGQRNYIAGNGASGISISANTNSAGQIVVNGTGAQIEGNYIGVNAAGTAMISNGFFGVGASAAGITIGGATAAHGNLIVSAGNNAAVSLLRQFAPSGALIDGAGASLVRNNIIGLDATQTVRLNGATGVDITSAGNQILDNVIAGNGVAPAQRSGISIGASGNNTLITGNFIGTNAGGAGGLGNTGTGIFISGASGTFIGGTAPSERNVIAANGQAGVSINAVAGQSSNNNTIAGNYIGTVDGSSGPGNGNNGVMLFSSGGGLITNTMIGGATASHGNVIARNQFGGVSLGGSGTTNNVVRNNRIGVLAAGLGASPNAGAGVFINDATDNLIEENLIAFNNTHGVQLNSLAVRNRILGNSIRSNTAFGIELGNDSVTANDPGDADTGANNLQNYPVLTNATNSAGATTRVNIDLSSFATGLYTVEVFANAGCDGSGNGEGERRIQVFNGFAAPSNGQFFLAEAVPQGQFITATATDAQGNTSEFSGCVEVDPVVSFAVTNTNDSGAGSLRQAMLNANTVGGEQTITFNIPGAGPGTPALITVAGPLPVITERVVIDATTQPGWDGQPVVQVHSPSTSAGWTGFHLNASNITIKGLSITGFSTGMLGFQTFSGHLIEYNIVGTTRNNAAAYGNLVGLDWRASASTIRENVISGNDGDGVSLLLAANSNTISSNRIGVGTNGLTLIPNGGHGIVLFDGPSSNVIEDNVISGNGGFGISLANNGGSAPVADTRIRGNNIGLTSAGDLIRRGVDDYVGVDEVNFGPKLRGNLQGGINLVSAPGTIIGESGRHNVISGNTQSGIRITGTFSTPPQIQFNRIGLDPPGMLPRGNTDNGVFVEGGASSFTIGGEAPGTGNYISGNLSDGIQIFSGHNINIYQNIIGLAVDGLQPYGNGQLSSTDDPGCCHAGVTVNDGNAGIRIGAPGGFGNTISGNNTGVWLGGSIATRVESNRIGLAHVSSAIVPNDGDAGIALYTSIDANVRFNEVVGSSGYAGVFLYGANDAIVDENIIRDSTNSGVIVANYAAGPNAGANRIRKNSIYGNGGLGIDLGWNGPTLNDAGDTDGDPNGQQNFPVLSNAENNGGNFRVTVDTTGFAAGVYLLQFFSTPACDANGYGEGQTFIGETTFAANDIQSIVLGGTLAVGHAITATATNSSGDTSEFSLCTPVQP
jgi:parallel beta-helix repeat protein